jgi:S-adenosylmethionine:tRNA ribosyltransferase-isomerase
MKVSEFNYELPDELIAQRPAERRDASRLLSLSRVSSAFEDRFFSELPQLMRGDELLVLNNTRVRPARLFGKRSGVHAQRTSISTKSAEEFPSGDEHLSGVVEIFLVRRVEGDTWQALVRPGKKLPVGERVIFGTGELEAEIVERGELGIRTICFHASNESSVDENIERLGHVPLPPYINRVDDTADRERYQTVFAKKPGAVAAPTAGLHFTPEILEKIRERGCEICELTLDVGLGTFQAIHSETLEEHAIHAENYEIIQEAAEKIIRAKEKKRPLLAVGTTVVRALEGAAQRAEESGAKQIILPGKAETGIFIKPGYEFRVVDMLLTNFHLPKSTLLALVSAFAGREEVLAAYAHAVEERYRFYSYGDCMLIR